MTEAFDRVLVIDLNSADAQLIARRIREAKVFSEILPHFASDERVRSRRPGAIVLSVGEGAVVDQRWFGFGVPVAVYTNAAEKVADAQWRPEVLHTDEGRAELHRFLLDVAGLGASWTPASIIADAVASIREQVGERHVLCALSGGVDSAVAAALVHEAIGDQLTCAFVDHGLLRKGEREQVMHDFVAATGIRLVVADAEERFLGALAGISDPETKRKTIGHEFIRVFEQTVREIADADGIDFLVQGTLYPDVVESGADGATNIKSHHNVGGLPDDLQFTLIEPLRDLFKDEVRAVGEELGLPAEMVWRHPFPGPGLGIRVIGEVTKERLDLLRDADAIARVNSPPA